MTRMMMNNKTKMKANQESKSATSYFGSFNYIYWPSGHVFLYMGQDYV